ncbi:Thioredoxin 1 [Methanosarcinaceae archaeon Ag5]|uniref:Thioredoxin 1 n=1 Tax=Methanolapillus africanus TaxID=3028297 RepID=A0AAE4MHG7_9EURY|nr:Thioredoxin 1 [Methanosarcinaceae archaeon Ag5]
MTSNVIEATTKSWDVSITSDLPVISMFYMTSCTHCQRMKPVFEELADKYKDKVVFVRIEAMENIDVTKKYGIKAAPTFKYFKDGKLLNEADQALSADELKQVVDDLANGKL